MSAVQDPSSAVLKVEALSVFYGGIHALRDVHLEVQRGQLTALIGANGAGKTTTLKAVCGLLTPARGSIRFNGVEIAGMPPHLIARRGLVLCPEGRRLFPNLTVDENLDLGAYGRHDHAGIRQDLERLRATFPILRERRAQLAGTLSGGEQQVLAIARALMSRPKLLMLDEPSLGLAPMLVTRIFAVLKELREQQVTILLVEQNARQALEIADHAYVLETGRVVKAGSGRDLANDPAVVAAYLGG